MRFITCSKSLLAGAALLAAGCIGAQAQADSIVSATQTAIGTSAPTIDLTSQGSVDWFDYDATSVSNVTYVVKNVGTGTNAINGGKRPTIVNVLGPNVGFGATFNWTDAAGASPSGTSTGMMRANIDTAVGGGASFTFTVTPDGNLQTLTVYAGNRGGGSSTVTDTYQLANSTTPVELTNQTGGANGQWYDTVQFQAAASDPLTVTISEPQTTASGGNLDLAAATLSDASPTPEPASLGLMGIGGAALMLLARRRRA